jgi:RNA polymerase sigma-70 factor (ECF subfamily)
MSPETLFDRALERYERPLVSYARTITGELESARDAVQETFLRLSRQDLAALEPRLAPWLFFVCRNCALDHCRKVVRFSDTAVADDLPDSGPSPADEVRSAEDATQLRALIARLPLQQQELVKLKFEAGLSYKEIGETMRMSVSNVGVQLHNTIQTLRQQWNRENQTTRIPWSGTPGAPILP